MFSLIILHIFNYLHFFVIYGKSVLAFGCLPMQVSLLYCVCHLLISAFSHLKRDKLSMPFVAGQWIHASTHWMAHTHTQTHICHQCGWQCCISSFAAIAVVAAAASLLWEVRTCLCHLLVYAGHGRCPKEIKIIQALNSISFLQLQKITTCANSRDYLRTRIAFS